MKTSFGIIVALAAMLLSLASCEKENGDKGKIEVSQIGTYHFNGEEYPVHSIAFVADDSIIAIMISPLKDNETKSTYAVIGINSSLEGNEIDIERAWHNDDYYFVYEDPVRFYSQYRKLNSGTLYLKRTGDNIEISADLILPDGTDFQFEYSGTVSAIL